MPWAVFMACKMRRKIVIWKFKKKGLVLKKNQTEKQFEGGDFILK